MWKTILDYLEETGRKFPNKTAFADPHDSICFCELISRARLIGGFLIKHFSQGAAVPFFSEKSVVSVTGLFGAIYAGCPYSFINTRNPPERIRAMLETLKASALVTDRDHEMIIKQIVNCPVYLIEDILQTSEIKEKELNERRFSLIDTDPLYINFTSGSTGTPKGIAVSHRNVLDFITAFIEQFDIDYKDTFANQAPFDFDVSVKDIYSGIITGARVEIIPTSYFMQPKALIDFLCDRQVTVMAWAVSALWFLTTLGALKYRVPKSVRIILFSGEVMPVKHLHKLMDAMPDVTYVNLYGPTETTCNCTYYVLNRHFELDETIPIGVPFRNRRVFLLNENDQEVLTPGETGELCVVGSGVALGYWNAPERTAESFKKNPLNPFYEERMYRTGDLIRICQNGEWIFVGRKDFQIKHRGYRIELTEIDTAIQALPGVDRACCQYIKETIVCFVCANVKQAEISGMLRKVLPEYMIPNQYYYVDTMPINKNGKIDRQILLKEYLEGNK